MMTTYTASPRPGAAGYDVHIKGSDGIRQTMLDFETEADADAWIASDKERDRIVAGSRVVAPSITLESRPRGEKV